MGRVCHGVLHNLLTREFLYIYSVLFGNHLWETRFLTGLTRKITVNKIYIYSNKKDIICHVSAWQLADPIMHSALLLRRYHHQYEKRGNEIWCRFWEYSLFGPYFGLKCTSHIVKSYPCLSWNPFRQKRSGLRLCKRSVPECYVKNNTNKHYLTYENIVNQNKVSSYFEALWCL